MSNESPLKNTPGHGKESKLADHILPSSATMIGVCMTVISLAHLIPKQSISRHVNDMLALDSLLFLGSAMLSYFSIRRPMMAEKFEKPGRCHFFARPGGHGGGGICHCF